MINVTDTISLMELWEKINENLIIDAHEIVTSNGAISGTQIMSYNNIGIAAKAYVDPEFDVGTVFGYTIKKWTGLVKNYVDFNYLDIVRNEIATRTKKKSRSYNYSMHFANKHGSGKDCLIALVFSARVNDTRPTVTFITRVSEGTCRLIFDFLLVQRCIEYVYGHNNVEVVFSCPTLFITGERVSMYHNHKDLFKIIEKGKKKAHNRFQDRVETVLNKMLTTDPDKITYRVNKRSAKNLQKNADGTNLSNVKSLKLKDLTFNLDYFEYPEDIIDIKARKKFKDSKK